MSWKLTHYSYLHIDMAQAPPEQADPNPDRKHDTKTCFAITDCPICLKSLRKPKSLPCLHTFCQECLSIYITRTEIPGIVLTCFDCPVCRRQTLPTQPASTPATWASHFPTNSFVLEMMKLLKPEDSTPQICHPCFDRKNENVAVNCWCQDCSFFLCEACHEGHKLVLYKHKVFSMEELSQHPMVLIPTNPTCTEHNEKLSLICLNHDILGCHMCIAIEHRKCDDVTSVAKYAESLKSKEICSKFKNDMDKNIEDIDEIISQCHSKLDAIAQDKDKALQRLSDARKCFDGKASRLTEEVMKTYKDETDKVKKELDSIEAVLTSMLQTKAMKETAQDENQLVTTVMRGKSEMSRCEEIVESQDGKTVRINMKFKDEFGIFLKDDYVIGTVDVISQRLMSQIGTISVPSSGDIRGLIVLPNETLIVSDYDGSQLLLLRESGELLDKLSLNGSPWDLCLIPNGDIAVSVENVDKISIIRVSSSKLSLVKDIPLKVRPDGVTFYKGALHITSELTLLRVSDNGNTTQLQTLPSESWFLTTRKDDQLIGTCTCALNGEKNSKTGILKLSPENVYSEVVNADLEKNARGVAVDDEDNIYVSGEISNNVVQISADGSTTTEVINSKEDWDPFVLYVYGEKLYVGENTGNVVKIFRLG